MSLFQLFLQNARAETSNFMPAAVTEISKEVNTLYFFLLVVSTISCLILIGGMIYFALKYKRRTNTDKTAYITHNTFLEFIWSFVPLVVFLFVFAWGWIVYHEMRNMPSNAFEVHVVARQWAWEFKYKSGKDSANEFYVPVNKPIRLIMTSQDVIHSFYIPSMRLKQDVVPGRYTDLWFTAEKMGDFQVFCAEFCGREHSAMLGKIHVVSQEDFDKYIEENDEGLTLAQRGAKLYNLKGCVACHSTDGTVKIGPSWKGIWGKTESFADGSSGAVDENYVRESIMTPAAKIVKGFNNVMPSFQGQLGDEEIAQIIEYIKELK